MIWKRGHGKIWELVNPLHNCETPIKFFFNCMKLSMSSGPGILVTFHWKTNEVTIKKSMMKALHKPIRMNNKASHVIAGKKVAKVSNDKPRKKSVLS